MRTLAALASFAVAASSGSIADARSSIKVSYLAGQAEIETGAGAPRRALRVGALVSEGDTVETHPGARIELSLPDGSKLRLGADTKITLSEASFASKERKVTISVWLGKLWAKAAKALGAEDRFEVETKNAVVGVRGTAFAVQAAQDLSAVVRVYAGTVGVRKGDGDAGFAADPRTRRRIQGPNRIDRRQWEEIIASAMKQVKISSLGVISPAEDFEDAGEELEWSRWNRARDRRPAR